jgi:hypothetical protein
MSIDHHVQEGPSPLISTSVRRKRSRQVFTQEGDEDEKDSAGGGADDAVKGRDTNSSGNHSVVTNSAAEGVASPPERTDSPATQPLDHIRVALQESRMFHPWFLSTLLPANILQCERQRSLLWSPSMRSFAPARWRRPLRPSSRRIPSRPMLSERFASVSSWTIRLPS